MNIKKKILFIVLGIIAVAIVVLIFFAVKWPGGMSSGVTGGGSNGSTTGGATDATAPTGITDIAINQSAYQIALARATAWEPDAALTSMVSTDATGNTWTFTFVSPKNKGQGLTVIVDGQNILSVTKVTLVDSGTPLPANIISPDDAIADAHAVPGYADATIVSVNLIYNANSKRWSWGLKTSAGNTLTVPATP